MNDKKRGASLKWEFDVILTVLFPFLTTKEQRRFGLVNTTMHGWVEESCRVHLKRNHVSDVEMKRFFAFAKKENKGFLTQKLMFEEYKKLRLRGKERRSSLLKSSSKASLTVLIFYLHMNNPRALRHLMHICRDFAPELRTMVRRLWLKAQLHLSKYKVTINTEKRTETREPMKQRTMKRQASGFIRKNRSCPVPNGSRKRRCTAPVTVPRTSRRQTQAVKRYAPSLDTKFLDDKSEEDEEINLSADEGIEERSCDSDDSEGSLADFIVKDDEEEDEVSSEDEESEESKEGSFSDGETSCDSDFSVYSD